MKMNILTKEGRIWQSYINNITIKYTGHNTDTIRVGLSDNIAEIRLVLNKNDEIKITKNYLSFFGVIAFLGGLVKALSFILLATQYLLRQGNGNMN